MTEQDFKDEFPDATSKEITAYLLIMNTVKRYLPMEKKYHIPAYQLIFCLFANDVPHYAQYAKFTRKICPVTSCSHINALKIDAASRF